MLPELASDKIDPAQRWFDVGQTLSHQISGRDYQAARRGDGYLLRRELFDLGDYPTTPRLVERYVTDQETFSLVLAELDEQARVRRWQEVRPRTGRRVYGAARPA
jgi:pyruvate dehydrogenase complex dehydrogenase (E1) component